MVASADMIERLREVGLTLNEARCYLALLQIAPATAAEVAEAAGVPRPKVYATLKGLEQRSFCFSSGSIVTKFAAVDPGLALAELVRGREHERRLMDERERRSVQELIELLPEARDPAPSELESIMRLMHGPQETVRMLDALVDEATDRVDIIHSTSMVQPEDEWNVHELAALRRGVRVRVLIPTQALAETRRLDELAKAGGEVRQARDPALKMMVRDGVEAIVSLTSSPSAEPAIVVIRHADLVAPLQLLFNREWRRSAELYR